MEIANINAGFNITNFLFVLAFLGFLIGIIIVGFRLLIKRRNR